MGLVLFITTPAMAQEMVKEFGLFFAGWTTGFINHEVGHYLTANLLGVDIEWRCSNANLTYYIRAKNGVDLRNTALGGTAAEILSSEALLYSRASKDNAFVIGWLTFNIVNPIQYVIRHELQNGYGDLEIVKKHENGLKVEYLEAIKVGHALFTAYRLWNNKEFRESKIKTFFLPTKNGGFVTGLTYNW